MGRISPGPTRWPPGAERCLVPAKSNLKLQTFLISKTDLVSTYLPHLQGVNLPMAIWNLQLLRRMLTTNCLRSQALSLLLIPAVLI